MNDSLHKDFSVYQLALGVEAPPQPLLLNPAIMLSLVRSQIDLLIEQQINATFLIKLPPGKIWHTELARYQSSVDDSGTIYTCQIREGKLEEKQVNKWENGQNLNLTSSFQNVDLQLLSNIRLYREYFLIVLSPQFSSLTVAYRPTKKRQTRAKKNPPLLAITTTEKRIIQQVLDGIKQVAVNEPIVPNDFICPNESSPILISQLLAKQLQRQDELNQKINNKRIAKLKQQNQKLHQREQLKDEYLGSVCQELRTPLTQMKTALSLLNSPTLKMPQRQRYLQMLNTQCDRQSTLITSLLDLVELEHNLEKTTLELVNLADIVPGVVSTYQPLAQERGIMLGYTVSTGLPPVWCVNGGIRQIVINLLHNSIKFTPNGGQAWVRARLQGEYVQLEFRDTGIGIAESEIPKIFDCFYRVRSGVPEDMSGAGLGLTIVQRLLWRCGGSITVKSKPYEGSTFTVQLVKG